MQKVEHYSIIAMPEAFNLTKLKMKLFDVVHISHELPEIKEKVMAAIEMCDNLDREAHKWKDLFFNIANHID
jgi:hypothetical protein